MSCRRFPVNIAALVVLVGVTALPQLADAQTIDEVPILDPSLVPLPESSPSYLNEPVPPSPSACVASSPACDTCCDTCTSCATCEKPCDRWYLGLSGGWQERETVHEVGDAQTFIVFDSGFLINAQLGYRFDVFRVEAEYSFMNNGVDSAGAGGASTPAAGNVNLKAFMFNIYHDFQLFDWLWEPYLGAGIGIYQSEINGLYPEFFDALGAPFAGNSVNATSDMPLAYQFRAGVSRPVGKRTEFLVGYRYFRGEELEFSSAPFATFAPTFHPDGAKVHSLELGFRVRF